MKRCDVRDVTSAAAAPTYVLANTTVRWSLAYERLVRSPARAGGRQRVRPDAPRRGRLPGQGTEIARFEDDSVIAAQERTRAAAGCQPMDVREQGIVLA